MSFLNRPGIRKTGQRFPLLILLFHRCRLDLKKNGYLNKKDTTKNLYAHLLYIEGYGFMVFNAIFNNISVISRQSGLLVEETGVPAENHRSVASH